MRLVIVILVVGSFPALASAQQAVRSPTNGPAPGLSWSVETESHTATTLYLLGSSVLVLGAGATLGLGLGAMNAGLAGLGGAAPAGPSSRDLELASLVVGCTAATIGLALMVVAIYFDVDSGARRAQAGSGVEL